MSRSIKGTDRRYIKSVRKAEQANRRIRKEISRANGR